MNSFAQPSPIQTTDAIADSRGRLLRDLRISITDRCNFRCHYCMPAAVFGPGFAFTPSKELLTPDEIGRLAQVFATLGVRKLRITGGEPTLRAELAQIIERVRAITAIDDIAMTSNGSRLALLAPVLKQAGLTRVTVSLDSLDEKLFRHLSGGSGQLGDVLAGIEAAQALHLGPVKINTVVQRGVNDHEVIAIAERFRGRAVTPRFIEFMDVGNCNGWSREQVRPSAELLAQIHARWPLEPIDEPRAGTVAERYRYLDGGGEVGFISSVTQPFCADCGRARISATGVLYTCLFANHGLDLKALLRRGYSDDELQASIRAQWHARSDHYSEIRATAQARRYSNRIEMHEVGG